MPTMPGDAGLDRSLAFLRELIDTPADVGPGYLKGRLARWRAERWAGRLVDDVRRGQCGQGR